MHRADNVRPSGPSNDRGEQQRQRLRAECRPLPGVLFRW